MPTEGDPTTSTRIPRYPDVRVRLVGEDGNALAILGRTKRALQHGGAAADDIAEFLREATSGSYDQLLATLLRWVDVE